MHKRNRGQKDGIVYSTDPSFSVPKEDNGPSKTLLPGEQRLYIQLDTRHRAGKAVTIVSGFSGTEQELEAMARQLKGHCGTGGSVKSGEIIIQGDQRQKVMDWLLGHGYAQTKKY